MSMDNNTNIDGFYTFIQSTYMCDISAYTLMEIVYTAAVCRIIIKYFLFKPNLLTKSWYNKLIFLYIMEKLLWRL